MHRVSWLAWCLALTLLAGCSNEAPKNPSGHKSTSGFIERDSARLPYIREGNGVPAVVIGTSLHYSRAFSMSLREHLDLIFADGRHFAPTYEPSEPELGALNLETWVDDVEALRQSLGIDQWIVVGHSIQAQIALAYARKYPHAVSRLVLIAGVPYSIAEFRQASEKLWDSQASNSRKSQHEANVDGLEQKLAATPAERRFVVNYVAQAAVYWADPKYDSTPLWEGVRTNPALARLAQIVPERSEVKDVLDGLDMPTLVVVGKQDYGVPFTAWEELVADNPAITFVLMEEDSHNPQAESPDRFDPILVEWLEL